MILHLLWLKASSSTVADLYRRKRKRPAEISVEDTDLPPARKKGRDAVLTKTRCRVGTRGQQEGQALLRRYARQRGEYAGRACALKRKH